MNDERRLRFPYSDIPSHNERIGFKKYITVNQLLDYDTIYTVIRDIGDGPVTTYCKVVKSKDTAIIIQDIILSSPFYMTCDELESFEISNAKRPRVKMKWIRKMIFYNIDMLYPEFYSLSIKKSSLFPMFIRACDDFYFVQSKYLNFSF